MNKTLNATAAILIISSLIAIPAWAAGPRTRAAAITPLSDSLRRSVKAPSLNMRENFRKFVAKSANRSWRVRYSPKTAMPEALMGGRTLRYGGGAQNAAISFLRENAELLKVDTQALKLAYSRNLMGITHLQYDQLYRTIPVEFAYVRVHVNAKGEVIGYQSKFEPDINTETTPSFPSQAAAASALADMGISARLVRKELVLFPDTTGGTPKLAWKMRIRAANASAGVWVYYLSATDGTLLFKYNDLRYACSAPNNVTTGTVRGAVYDISPVPTGNSDVPAAVWTAPVTQPITDQYVWVGSYATSTVTVNGQYCSGSSGKVFASLKGPYFSVNNFRGTNAHFDNGEGQWDTQGTTVESPHPYANSQNYPYSVSLTDDWTGNGYTFAKVMPRFTAFTVGEMTIDGAINDTDEVHIKNGAGNTIASYLGTRTSPFMGGAIENPSYSILLKTDDSGTYNGFSIDISSYLVLTNAPGNTVNATGSILWSTATSSVYLDQTLGPANGLSEVNAFYHLNKARNYFNTKLNKDPARPSTPPMDISTTPVAVMVHAHGAADAIASRGGMLNAFYDLEQNNIFLGDGPLDSDNNYRAFALDGTIVRHEYNHYIVNQIYPIINFGEFGAISEAMADYFSLSSLLDDGQNIDLLGNYVDLLGSGEGGARSLTGASPTGLRVMPTDWWGEVHEDGLILSQALWDLRKGVNQLGSFSSGDFSGTPRADVFTFAALFYFPDSYANFYDALLDACMQLEPSCAASYKSKIDSAFSAHGILSIPSGGDSYEDMKGSGENNNGPEWATDISSISTLSATIYPLGDVDYYALPLAPGNFTAKISFPVTAMDGVYHAYSLFLFDENRNFITEAAPPIYNSLDGFCQLTGDCQTQSADVTLQYTIARTGRYYLVVSGALNGFYGNSEANSTTPYILRISRAAQGSARAYAVTASFDNDEIFFSVPFSQFPMSSAPSSSTLVGAEQVFQYAQLRDHNLDPLALARTDIAGGYLTKVSASTAAATYDSIERPAIEGILRLNPGFAARYPGVGSVYIEVFGRNHLGRVMSLGISNAINLATDRSDVNTYNNIISGANARAMIKYDLQSPGTLTIKIYTLSGALVKTVYDGPVSAGKGTIDWDASNLSGTKVASGIYYVKVKGPGLDKTDKIAVVR